MSNFDPIDELEDIDMDRPNPATKFGETAAQVMVPIKRDDRPSIAELQREVPLWPTNWEPALGEEGEWSGFWWCRDANGSEDRVSADVDEDYAGDFARIVAMTRNAMPMLLEIAAAALVGHGMTISPRLKAALARVRP